MLRSWLQPTRTQRHGDLCIREGERHLRGGVHGRPDALGEQDGARSWLPWVAWKSYVAACAAWEEVGRRILPAPWAIEEPFWRAVRNFSGCSFILASDILRVNGQLDTF